ncbi:hypothetical protein MJO29_006336 [Puccinia striiformis f. sp. tritici]|nr:hypothetical protein MJO29_006336 [Puccinia striiformis f. sp. tritici]
MKKQPSYSEASIIPNSFGPYIGTHNQVGFRGHFSPLKWSIITTSMNDQTELALICGSRQRRIKCERLNDPSVDISCDKRLNTR